MTYHHLMSRIAHKVYFLTEEVRSDFIEMIRRAADFCGIRLLAWCIMTNHFHLLAYLPMREQLSEDEILRRYGVLKGNSRLKALVDELAAMRRRENGERDAQERLEAITKQMYDIGEFMKIVKQWMTQEYNRRYAHVGTLWEAVYKDVIVPAEPAKLAERAGYIHLNPIRAAICTEFAEYPWSSFTAFSRGDDIAISGLRFIYGEDAPVGEIAEAHRELMAKLLEQIKLERALEIVRKRQAGFDMPPDPLTSEALLSQAAEHIKKVQDESIELKMIRRVRGRPAVWDTLEKEIAALLAENPKMSAAAIMEATGRSRSLVYQCLKQVRQSIKSRKEV